jgi:MFS family permease
MIRSFHRYYGITVAICCLFMTSSLGACMNADSIFLTPMSEGLGVSRGAITLYTSLAGMASFLLYPLAFRLTKRISLRSVVLLGICIATAACVGMGAAHSIYFVYFCAVLRGFGTTCYASNMVVSLYLNRWFRDKIGTVTGIVLSMVGISAAILNPILNSLILSLGYQAAMMIRAGIVLLTGLPGALIMKETPEMLGLEPYRSPKQEKTADRMRETAHAVPFRVRSILFVVLAAYFILSSAAARLVDQLPGYAESIGQGPRVGALMASAFMLGSAVFKLLIGALNDAVGAVKAAIAGGAVALAALGMLAAFPGSVVLLLAGSFLYATMLALASVSIFALVRYAYGSEQTGAAISILVPISSVYTVLTSTYGYLFDATGTFLAVFALCACFGLICIVLVLLVVWCTRRNSPGSAGQPGKP